MWISASSRLHSPALEIHRQTQRLMSVPQNTFFLVATTNGFPHPKNSQNYRFLPRRRTSRSNTKIIPVPLNPEDATKEALDADVRMDNLEPLPEGEPITWFHQMVIPQQHRKRMAMSDFQSLNKHATKEKHHTLSPFPRWMPSLRNQRRLLSRK